MAITERIADQEWRPNLFIAGFSRCGTTEFCDYLSQHQDIFLSWEKEPNTFYDLKYPSFITGDRTGNTRSWSVNLDDYYELFSKGKRHRYRIDGSVCYTYDPKFSHILKSFSENAKVILLVRNQKRRLASVYFYSFVHHKENDFTRWVADYFIPEMKVFLFYDKIIANYHEFGDNNLRIIDTNNLSSEDVHKQVFEYLGVKPIKISVRHKNTNLLGPTDNKAYRQLILSLSSIRVGTLKFTKRTRLEKQGARASLMMALLARKIFSRQNNDDNYSQIINLIPDTISSILDEDYRKSVDFAVQKRIMIRPTC